MPAPNSAAADKDGVRATSITVVGIGNQFRGDDAAGVLAVRNLAEQLPPNASAVELEGDQSRLLELMQSASAMIIVDAVQSRAPAGTIFRMDASKESMPQDFFAVSTHGLDLIQAIELARSLNLLPKHVIVYGIVGKDFSYTKTLSPQTQESVEIIQNKVLSDIDLILKDRDGG